MLTGKSFRTKKDDELINFNSSYAKVNIYYLKKDRNGNIRAEIGEKKNFFVNEVKQSKISDIVGKINVVTFTPDDIDIIKDGPSRRRKFLDMLICSLKPNYINLLNKYNKILDERNNYLKQIKKEKKDIKLLDIWDEQLSETAIKIYEYRKIYTEKIKEKINVFHKMVTKSGKEELKIKYISNCKDKESCLENLKKSRQIDIQRGFTAIGVHRDELIFYINDRPANIYGSQGQQRSTVLSLKLCELDIIKEEIGEEPILLLDDFMSELDNERRTSLLENIETCQVIITCTDKFDFLKEEKNIFYVENGFCKQE